MIKVNNSLLTMLATCETLTYVRWMRELASAERSLPGPMDVGVVVHEALADWMWGRTVEGILDTFDRAWIDQIGSDIPKQERLHPGNVRRVLEHWLNAQPRRDIITYQTEKYFEVPFGVVRGEEVIYYGTPDAILGWKGEFYVLDHKSTGSIDDDWSEQWSMNTGLQGYVWGLREQGFPIKGAFVNGIEIRKLPPWDGNMGKKCSTHKLKYKECQPLHVKGQWAGPFFWSDRRLDQWRTDALRMVERLLELREGFEAAQPKMDGQFRYPGCNGGSGRAPCQFRSWCQARRPLARLEFMPHQAWRGAPDAETEESYD